MNIIKKELVSYSPISICWTAEVIGHKDSKDENWGVVKSGHDCFGLENLAEAEALLNHRAQKKRDLENRRINRKAEVTNAELDAGCSFVVRGLSGIRTQ